MLRALLERDTDLEVVAVNDLTEPDHARAAARATTAPPAGSAARSSVDGDTLVVDGRRITVLAERDPAQLPWAELERRHRAGVHRPLHRRPRPPAPTSTPGAKKVLVSAPADGADVTLAFGVNTDAYDPAVHTIVSNASCTTNALAPLAAVLDDLAGIEHGFMTTVHAYTQEQNLQDGPHRDARRARAAGVNIVPTTTVPPRRSGWCCRTSKASCRATRSASGYGGLDRRTQHDRRPRRDARRRAGRVPRRSKGPLAGYSSTRTTRSCRPTSRATLPPRSSTRP